MKNNNQNRRDFLISVSRKSLFAGLSFIGGTLGYKTLSADKETLCEVNLPCRGCFKLGNCGEDKAAETRKEVRNNHAEK